MMGLSQWFVPLSFLVFLVPAGAETPPLQVFALNAIDEGGATHAVIWRGDDDALLRVRSVGLPDRIVLEQPIEDRVTPLSLSGVPNTLRFEIRDQARNRLAEQQAEPLPWPWESIPSTTRS